VLAWGKDRIAERDGERAITLTDELRSMSFDPCAQQAFIVAHRDGWRIVKHAEQRENTLRLQATEMQGRIASI
jgi:hypothetical protein